MDAKVRITHDKLKAESWVVPESVAAWESKGWKLDKKDAKEAADAQGEELAGPDLKASLEGKDLSTQSGSTAQ